ncbi:MAG TPA: DNA primase [Acidimicrobiales bacterium]|nr:DNA primase [Acidimicrobiales bacterium]
MAISEEDVARVRAATDIVALIGEHSALKRQGTRWVGLCPFHQEKTPSFSVNAEMGLYYCFGCQRSGDAITFVRDVEHLDFVDAVRRLAERAGITITEDAQASAERKWRAPLYSALSDAVAFYHERLLSAPDAGPARDYLRSRGYDGEVVRRFQLGWAPDDWDALARHLGVPEKILTDAGLGFVNRLGRQQDAFRARVIFPIFDPSGKAVALGGRVLPGAATANGAGSGPKYKNSPESPVYSKRRTLYGLNWAKQDVVASEEVIVCEGYTDVIAFFLAGMPRAVATCGTALGEEHFRLLRNFARRVVLAYDADAAGQAGAGRVYEWERHHEVDVAVAALPANSDPADLAMRDPDALRKAVAEAQPFLAFRLQGVLEAADLRSPEGRVKAAEAAMAVVAEHPNELVRDQYLMVVADRTRLEPQALRDLASRQAHGEGGRRPAGRAPAPEADQQGAGTAGDVQPAPLTVRRSGSRVGERHRAELEALRLAVHNPELVADRLEPVLFPDDTQRAAFEVLSASQSLHEAIESAAQLSEEVADLLHRLAVEEPSADADDVVVQLVRFASRRALAEIDAQARISPGRFVQLATTSSRIKKEVEDLDDPGLCAEAADRLLAWLVERGEETA